mmetsp:Transcript_27537/g.69187  ORF Transcript_27537/g.69187 Transcript_27537/m.69187 type:complete len:261 (-) Transcript_27537:712-1494(-)
MGISRGDGGEGKWRMVIVYLLLDGLDGVDVRPGDKYAREGPVKPIPQLPHQVANVFAPHRCVNPNRPDAHRARRARLLPRVTAPSPARQTRDLLHPRLDVAVERQRGHRGGAHLLVEPAEAGGAAERGAVGADEDVLARVVGDGDGAGLGGGGGGVGGDAVEGVLVEGVVGAVPLDAVRGGDAAAPLAEEEDFGEAGVFEARVGAGEVEEVLDAGGLRGLFARGSLRVRRGARVAPGRAPVDDEDAVVGARKADGPEEPE